jgi:hypothetical protein
LRDKTKALKDFAVKLGWFRQFTPVQTVAMHGVPLSRVRNADMLVGVNLANYELLGEPYISPEFAELAYVTDLGRSWSSTAAPVGDKQGKPIEEKIKNTDALIKLLKSRKHTRLMVCAHSQRWSLGKGEWAVELVGQNVKNVGKRVLRTAYGR